MNEKKGNEWETEENLIQEKNTLCDSEINESKLAELSVLNTNP